MPRPPQTSQWSLGLRRSGAARGCQRTGSGTTSSLPTSCARSEGAEAMTDLVTEVETGDTAGTPHSAWAQY
eukprot:949945-Rhodomonas_salina.2